MDYATYRFMHWPIGSGITEAACKVVFTQRFKLAGMTWNVESGKWIAIPRTIHLSGIRDAVVAESFAPQCVLKDETRRVPLVQTP